MSLTCHCCSCWLAQVAPDSSLPRPQCTKGRLPSLPSTRSSPQIYSSRMSSPSHRICPFNIPTCPGCRPSKRQDDNDSAIGSLDEHPTRHHTVDARVDRANDHNCNDRMDVDSVVETVIQPWSPYHQSHALLSADMRPSMRPHVTNVVQRWFPANDHDTDFVCSKLLSPEILEYDSPSMEAAVEALSYILQGQQMNDTQRLTAGVSRYHSVVANLRVDLSRPECIYDDGVLGTVYVLGICELFQCLSPQGRSNRTHHVALQNMFLSRGSDVEYSPFAQMLLYNARSFAMAYALIDRKSCSLQGEAWRKRVALSSSITVAINELSLVTPGMLEEVDTCLLDTQGRQKRIVPLLLQLSTLESELQGWVVRWYSTFDDMPYRSTKITSYPHFTLMSATAPDVFPACLSFPCFSGASLMASYWAILLQTKHAMLELSQLCPNPLSSREPALVAEANECAANLCKLVPFLTQAKYGLCGIVLSAGPVYFAGKWYAQLQDDRRFQWCVRVRESLESTGVWSGYPSFDTVLASLHNTRGEEADDGPTMSEQSRESEDEDNENDNSGSPGSGSSYSNHTRTQVSVNRAINSNKNSSSNHSSSQGSSPAGSPSDTLSKARIRERTR